MLVQLWFLWSQNWLLKRGTLFWRWKCNSIQLLLVTTNFLLLLNILHFWQATLGFFGLANDPPDVINGLIHNLITLLCAILVTRYLFLQKLLGLNFYLAWLFESIIRNIKDFYACLATASYCWHPNNQKPARQIHQKSYILQDSLITAWQPRRSWSLFVGQMD